MLRLGLFSVVLLLLSGCENLQPFPRTQSNEEMFGPATIRIHPTFTQIRDWSGHGKPDGIEALLEVQDQFGEPTRSSGKAIFELYAYRKISPNVRGIRLAGPWVERLSTKEDQVAHWNSALRGYTFQLPYEKIESRREYVLTVQFDLDGVKGGRMFDQLILEPQQEGKHERRPRASSQTPGSR